MSRRKILWEIRYVRDAKERKSERARRRLELELAKRAYLLFNPTTGRTDEEEENIQSSTWAFYFRLCDALSTFYYLPPAIRWSRSWPFQINANLAESPFTGGETLLLWLQLQQRKYHQRLRSPLLQTWNCEDQAPLHKRYYRSSFETRMRPRPPKWLMPQAASPASRRRFFCSRSMLGRISLESKVFQQFSWNPPLINYNQLTTSFWVKEEYCCYSSHLTYNAKDVFQI